MTGNYAWFLSFTKIKNGGDVSFGDNSKGEFSSCMNNEFEMSMMGELKYFLGLQIKQNDEGIFIN